MSVSYLLFRLVHVSSASVVIPCVVDHQLEAAAGLSRAGLAPHLYACDLARPLSSVVLGPSVAYTSHQCRISMRVPWLLSCLVFDRPHTSFSPRRCNSRFEFTCPAFHIFVHSGTAASFFLVTPVCAPRPSGSPVRWSLWGVRMQPRSWIFDVRASPDFSAVHVPWWRRVFNACVYTLLCVLLFRSPCYVSRLDTYLHSSLGWRLARLHSVVFRSELLHKRPGPFDLLVCPHASRVFPQLLPLIGCYPVARLPQHVARLETGVLLSHVAHLESSHGRMSAVRWDCMCTNNSSMPAINSASCFFVSN